MRVTVVLLLALIASSTIAMESKMKTAATAKKVA